MLAFVLGIVGGLLGAAMAEEEGFFFGGTFGFAIGLALSGRGTIRTLQEQVTSLTVELRTLQLSVDGANRALQALRKQVEATREASPAQVAATVALATVEPAVVAPVVEAVSEPPTVAAHASSEPAAVEAPLPVSTAADVSPATKPQAPAAPLTWEPARPDPIVAAITAARDWLFGGNTVVRIGTLVLLVGVVLLLKYAADHAVFPIEVRLSAAALIAIGLVGFGFKQRHARPGFSLTLQGGGIAAVYLVVFFAYRTYALIPSGFAFAGFVVVAAASGTLAVAQRSQSLAFIGTLGGFAAPILASSGSGNHVALFTYYLLLNVMVASVAWFRTWRALNLLAFTCTYGVATAWGVLRYQPDHFNSTEPFVIAFFLLFVITSVLCSLRGATQADGVEGTPAATTGGVVNGSLVFGTPLVTLLAQARLVEGKPLGMALSAAALGLFYVSLGTLLWKRQREAMRNLVESFVALGAAFGTLAIPFALDNALTTAMAWALEGAGAYWAGTRQKRRLPKLAGIALQALAFAALIKRSDSLLDLVMRAGDAPVLNVAFLSAITLTLAAFILAIVAYKDRQRRGETGYGAVQSFALWGYVIWVFACVLEVETHVPIAHRSGALLFVATLTAWLLVVLARAAAWPVARILSLALLLEAGVLMLGLLVEGTLLDGLHALAWPVVIISLFSLIERARNDLPGVTYLFAPAWWLSAAVIAVGAAQQVAHVADIGAAWSFVTGGAVGALCLFVGMTLVQRARGPFAIQRDAHLFGGAAPLVGALLLYCLSSSVTQRGDVHPLPYLPLLNPVDLSHALCLLAALVWHRHSARDVDPAVETFKERTHLLRVVSAGLGFVWLNAIVARSVHHYAQVPFDFDEMWRSVVMQSALSVTWTLTALVTMLWSTRKGVRVVWIVGAVLLGLVVLKLFTIDLAKLSTLLKIGTFLVVGLLLLAIGYFSPVPPAASSASKEPA